MSSLFDIQAARSRQLGATIYCVGVKDFNETQVSCHQSLKPFNYIL